MCTPRAVGVGQEQEVGHVMRRRGGAAAVGADGRAMFKKMFVSLVDPAGLLDTERCGRTAALMEEEASRSGYAAGVRMSRLLAAIFADVDHIASWRVEDGVLDHAFVAAQCMMDALLGTAEAYREGGGPEPIGELEEARNGVARLRSEADSCREEASTQDGPPGPSLPYSDLRYIGRTCRDVIAEDIAEIRADRARRGVDPVFPPKPKMLDGLLGDADDPNLSVADWLDIVRGKGPPTGTRWSGLEAADGMAKTGLYLDSGVIVALILLCGMRHAGAFRVLCAAKLSRCRLITSRLAVMEAIAVVRRKTAGSHRRRSGSGTEMASVEAHAAEAVSRLLEFIESMKSAHGLRVVDIVDRPLDLDVLQRMELEHAGRIIAPSAAGKKYRHRGVGACDRPHFWLAMCAGADMICTTDAAFADIAGSDDEFGHIQVRLTSGPLIGPLAGAGAA